MYGHGYSREEWLGTGRITPDTPAIAGEFGTWTIEYTVGVTGIDDGGHLRLAYFSSSDWSPGQTTDPAAPNFVSAHATPTVELTPVYGRDGVRPLTKTLTVLVAGDALYPGDTVSIVLGDRSQGSPGMRPQSYPERPFQFSLQVDLMRTGVYQEVTKLGIPIIGGPAARLLVTAPTDVVAGDDAWLQVCALDRWGNPDPNFRGVVRLGGDLPDGCPDEYRFTEANAGVHRFEGVRYRGAGEILTVFADGDDLAGSTSNPVRCHAVAPARRLYWADLHGQTRETGAAGSIEDYLRYGRDVSAIDATAHSGNDFDMPLALYNELRGHIADFYKPGRFVTFNGYEWSGNTPGGGDRNVYYLDDGPIRRSSHMLIEDKSDIDTDCFPIDRLYQANAGREDVILTPHIGGRPASLGYHDPSLEPAIEIASQWGRFEWFARDALERGMRVAFIAGSDDHSGRPGWSWPTLAHHGVRGGLTAFIAEELTREGIWEAFKARRCYGTSGPRIILDVTVNGHPIGSGPRLEAPPTLRARVIGAAPVERIEVRRGNDTMHVTDFLPEPAPGDPIRARLAWRGARNRGRTRALDWSGGATITNGRFTSAENYAIDSPLDGVTEWGDGQVRWRSHTCGDWDGVILHINGDDTTRIDVTTPTLNAGFSIADLQRGPVQIAGTLLEHELIVRRLPLREAPREVAIEWTDPAPLDGWNPYWIWVTQSDGELAWSTPVYARVGE